MLNWGGGEVQGVEQVQSQATHITQVIVHHFACLHYYSFSVEYHKLMQERRGKSFYAGTQKPLRSACYLLCEVGAAVLCLAYCISRNQCILNE
ncbi:hypothetical protein SAY86_002430 [Trapa natans]|uniref:Uncharacterized protein n=1 Tax=Trapa natans TaxID=22666 RepID=A0AAN7LFZ3_TRANT|nr:hypothetical protein SAY86_002430 [Trapa natans]